MKIALPVTDQNLESNISTTFARTLFYLIYDTDTQESDYIDNHAMSAQGGAGIKAAQIIVDAQVDALLTPQCGENAAKVLSAAHIQIFKTNSSTIMENINSFKEGHLKPLNEIHAGFHTDGH